MIFNYEYSGPMDRSYFEGTAMTGTPMTGNLTSGTPMTQDIEGPIPNPAKEEKPLIRISEIGQTVSEGPQLGTLLDQTVAAIRKGVSKIELQTTPEGGGAQPGGGGAESYGKEVREEIKKLAEINQVELTGVHAPPQIGNLSGLTQRGFDDSVREQNVTEIKKAIDFAGDLQGGDIVIHTGEFPRPIWDAEWNKKGPWKNSFMQYGEEPQKATKYLVDARTGEIIRAVAKNLNVFEPVYKKDEQGRYVDINGNPTDDPTKRVPIFITEDDVGKEYKVNGKTVRITKDMVGNFLVVPRGWDYFVKQAEEWNKKHPDKQVTPEEVFIKTRQQAQINEMRGWAAYYRGDYDKLLEEREKVRKALEFYEKLEKEVPEEEKWKLKVQLRTDEAGLIPPEVKNPSEYLREKLNRIDQRLEQIHESATAYEVKAKELEDALRHTKPLEEYAKEKSAFSYAELGIYAMKKSQEKKTKKPIVLTPEHIFPNMGYGSHPEELIQLVKTARKKMVDLLTKKKIPDPSGRTDENGNPVYIDNPYYNPRVDRKKAEKFAETHIKAKLDTQHLGMWYRYFVPRPGETEEQRKKRFKKWYMDMIKKMEKEKIIGSVHLVDGFGYGHTHLPAGQGEMPVKDAIEYLKKKGFKGAILSEGYGEGSLRIVTKPWELFGTNIYGVAVPQTRRWTDVHQSYFNKIESPYFIFGAYAPSNEWTLWSQVPFE